MIYETKQVSKKNTIYIIDILKAAACLMIFFYHCNSLLPGEWKWITIFGNSIGNNLFFMVSGFALLPSVERTELSGFPKWYAKRLLRILPMLLFFYILSFATGFITPDPAGLFTIFIYPSLYWFVTGILYFYILVFLLYKLLPFATLPVISAALFILWQIRPGTMESFYFIGLSAMILGMFIRKILDDNVRNNSGRTGIPVTALILSLISLILFIYISLEKPDSTMYNGITRLVYGACIILFPAGSLAGGYLMNDILGSFFKNKERFRKALSFIGNLALPLYLVQCFNAGMIGYTIGQRIVFPLSFAVNLLIVWSAAVLLEMTRLLIKTKLFNC